MVERKRPFDAVLKEVLTRLFREAGARFTTEYEVGRLPRTIDGVALLDQAAREWLGANTPLDFLATHVLLEGKSEHDRLTPQEYCFMMGRAYLYVGQVGVRDLQQVTVCAVSARRPRRLLQQEPGLVEFRRVGPALWRAETVLPFYVLVCSELELEERNYPFLLFAAGQKRQEFLRELVQEAGSPYFSLALELYPRAVMEEWLMAQRVTPKEDAARYMIEQLGAPVVLRALQPQISEALAAQPAEVRRELLRILLARVSREELETLLRERTGGGEV